jgi:hypothetical protein
MGVVWDWLEQADRQTEAAGLRKIEWYFAEKEVADYARNLFKETSSEKAGYEKIEVHWVAERSAKQ